MVQGSFSSQLEQRQREAQRGRATRTERIIQETRKRNIAEAQRLRTGVFVDRQVQETYLMYVPKEFLDKNGNPTRKWYEFNEKTKQKILNRTDKKDLVAIKKTRTVTDPFTFEEYKQEYQKLNPSVAQFFVSPQAIETEKANKISSEKATLQSKIDKATEKLNKTYQELKEFREWMDRQSSQDRAEKNERWNKTERELKDEITEYKDQIRYAQQKMSKIDVGASASQIWNYVTEKAGFERQREVAERQGATEFQKKLASGEFDNTMMTVYGLNPSDLLKKKMNEKITAEDLNKQIETYNKNVASENAIVEKAKKYGFENLTKEEQIAINPTAVQWSVANPTEKLIFDNDGNVIGVESGILQQSITMEEYNKIASKTPEDYYQEWLAKNPQDKTFIAPDFTERKTTLPYESRGTTNEGSTGIQYYSGSMETEKNLFSYPTQAPVIKQALQGFDYLRENVRFDFSLKGSSTLPTVSLISFGKQEGKTNIEKLAEKGQEGMDTGYLNIDKWVVGEDTIAEFKKTKEAEYQDIYQKAFENKYMKKMIYGEIDFETASEQFKESDEAKRIGELYAKEYTQGYNELKKVTLNPFKTQGRKAIIGGLGQTGISIGKLGLNLVDNPVELTATAGALYVGGAGIKALPTIANVGISGGFFVSGLNTTLDKTKTFSERGAGLFTTLVTGYSLGRMGYKYLNKPEVTPVKIPKPIKDLESTNIFGDNIGVTGNANTFKKTYFDTVKVAQGSTEGRRVIVTTKWRALSNKYLNTKFANIYEGIPSKQPAIVGYDVFSGERYVIKESGYQQALKKLLDYKYTKYEATSTLRYTAPKIKEVWLKSGFIQDDSLFATSGRFIYEVRQPVVDLGGGIQTRGARTVQTTTDFKRYALDINGKRTLYETDTIFERYLNKQGEIAGLKSQTTKTSTIQGASTDLIKYNYPKLDPILKQYVSPSFYRDIYSFSTTNKRFKLIPNRKQSIAEYSTTQTTTPAKTTIFEWNYDLDKMPLSNKKIVIQKGFGGAKQKLTYNADKVAEKIAKMQFETPVTSTTTTTTTARSTTTTSIVSPSTTTDQALKDQLRSVVAPPPITFDKLGSIPNVVLEDSTSFGFGILGGLGSKYRSRTGQTPDLDTNLMDMTQLRVNQITSQLLKQTPREGEGTNQPQGGRYRSPTITTQVINPEFFNPTITPPKIPKPFKVLPFVSGELKQKVKEKKTQKKKIEAFALFPDFTSRAIGLAPEEFGSVKDAMKEIRKIQTGFSIRRGGRIKGYSPFLERSLLKDFTR